MRRLLLILIPTLLPAQTLQFAASFGGTCTSPECGHIDGYWLPDTITSMAVDAAGNIYAAGISHAINFPLLNPIEPGNFADLVSISNFSIPLVAKFDPSGKLIYSTPIGEPLGLFSSSPIGITIAFAVDAAGNAYITGSALPGGFPTLTGTAPPLDHAGNDQLDAFFIKLDPAGKLLISTRFGGTKEDAGTAIALASNGAIYIAGATLSSDFPVTIGTAPASAAPQVFLARLDATGNLTYSAVIGPGNSPQLSIGLGGDILLAANTTSTAWATTKGVTQPACAGGPTCADVIAVRYRPSTSQIVFATYLGGSGVDTVSGVASDSTGSFYISGTTASFDFPTTKGALLEGYPCNFVSASACGTKAFVTRINAAATGLIYSTYLGGSATSYPGQASDLGQTLAIDAAGNAYIGGKTTTRDFPLKRALQSTIIPTTCAEIYDIFYDCGAAGFISELNPQGSALLWSTYLGRRNPVSRVDTSFFGVNALTLDAQGNVFAGGDDVAIQPAKDGTLPRYGGFVKIAPSPAPLNFLGLTNAASFAPGLPYGGGLATLFVSGDLLPTELSGITIELNGEPAPILAAVRIPDGRIQINFQVPVDIRPGPIVQVDSKGTSTFFSPPPVAPGIFVLGDGSAAIQHQSDYSLVSSSNPIVPGEYIIIYATGLGSPAITASPVVVIGNTSCTVLYAGPTSGFVGLDQINCQTSTKLNPGPQPLQMILNYGGQIGVPPLASQTNSNTVIVPVHP